MEQKRRPKSLLPYECFRKQFPFLRQFQRKFNLKCTFLQYFGLLAAIPRQWKDLLNVQGFQETLTSQLTIDKLNCKDLYNLIMNRKNPPPPTAEKKIN